MAEYKTIAGPIGLKAETGEAYGTAVQKYAAIIDAEAVGGWELHCIQQIPVTKSKINIGGLFNFVLIGAAVGFGLIMATGSYGTDPTIGVIVGGLLGGVIGAGVSTNDVVEFFNMLVFSKKQ